MNPPQGWRRFFTEENIVLLIRWWMAGAVYFFIGWGTRLGNQESYLDFAITLGAVLGIANIFFVNPGVRMMFNIEHNYVPGQKSAAQRTSDYLVELIKNIFIVLIITFIYDGINRLLISLLNLSSEAVPLPGEPILFGVFYVSVFTLIAAITKRIKQQIIK